MLFDCAVLGLSGKRPENSAARGRLFGPSTWGGIACAMALTASFPRTIDQRPLYTSRLFLGTTRVSLSALSKVAFGGSSRLKRLDPSGREVDTTLNVLRSLVVTMLTASAVAGVRPPCFWLPAAMQQGQ